MGQSLTVVSPLLLLLVMTIDFFHILAYVMMHIINSGSTTTSEGYLEVSTLFL